MSKFKSGALRSGGSGSRVKSRRQAIAIMLSEKRAAAQGKEEYQPSRHPDDAMRRALGRRKRG